MQWKDMAFSRLFSDELLRQTQKLELRDPEWRKNALTVGGHVARQKFQKRMSEMLKVSRLKMIWTISIHKCSLRDRNISWSRFVTAESLYSQHQAYWNASFVLLACCVSRLSENKRSKFYWHSVNETLSKLVGCARLHGLLLQLLGVLILLLFVECQGMLQKQVVKILLRNLGLIHL